MLNKNQLKRKEYILNLTNVLEKDQRYKYSITDLKQNSYLSFDKQNYIVESVGTYLETKWENFTKKKNSYIITELELFSLTTGKTTYIEYEEDDEIEAYITTKNIKLSDISFAGKKITKDVMDYIADEEEGDILYEGIYYSYDEDETFAALYNSSKHSNIPIRVFEFLDKDDNSLSIEFWYDDEADTRADKEAYSSVELNLETIEVLKI